MTRVDHPAVRRAPARYRVVTALGDWRGLPGPLHRRVASALRGAIEDGLLPPGLRLPSERALADTLGLSRGTVVAAFEVLDESGLVERRHGSGTYVRAGAGVAAEAAEQLPSGVLPHLSPGPDRIIDLSLSAPADARHLPPLRLGAPELFEPSPGHGYLPTGATALRETIAARLTRTGLTTTPGQLLVTGGAQQAISLAAGLLRPGDAVAVECPTYPGALAAFGRAGLRMEPVATDADGIVPDALAALCRRDRIAMVYTVPTGHNPTGAIASAERRRALVELAAAHNVLVVEDLTLAELVLDGSAAPPPLGALGDDHVISVGSLSKLLWGGLRIGWLRAADPVRARLARHKAAHDLTTSAVGQLLAVRLLAAADDAYLSGWRTALATRRETLESALADRLPDWSWTSPRAGMSLWVRLPGSDADVLAAEALRHGVAVAPGSTACLCERHYGHVRISFTPSPPTLLHAAIRLGRTWHALQKGQP